MTDNGTARGCDLDDNWFVTKGYNAGMRGRKGLPYEGGHRVPFFIHWPDGNLSNGRDIDRLAGAIDIAPTLLDLCDINPDLDLNFDGTSFKPLIEGKPVWQDRILFTDTQREDTLRKYKQYSIMTEEWRLVNGELYDINNDNGQATDVSKDYPEVVEDLMGAYEEWWGHTIVRKDDYTFIPLGDQKREQLFTQHNLHPESPGSPAWHQGQVRSGWTSKGYWAIEVKQHGVYRFELRRWPREASLKLRDQAPQGDLIPQGYAYDEGESLPIEKAILEIAGKKEEMTLDEDANAAVFSLTLEPGQYQLKGHFVYQDGQENSAYYLYASNDD